MNALQPWKNGKNDEFLHEIYCFFEKILVFAIANCFWIFQISQTIFSPPKKDTGLLI